MAHHITHSAVRLGDNLVHLHFLRKLCEAYPSETFTHFCHEDFHLELGEVVIDQPRIKLAKLSRDDLAGAWWTVAPPASLESVNAWKNCNGFWETHPLRLDYCAFMIEWFKHLAQRMGLESPILTAAQMLFDYPALKGEYKNPFDFLIVNSPPMSNQAPRYRLDEMDALIEWLIPRAQIITTFKRPTLDLPCTMDLRASVTGIGRLSQMCRAIIMVSTGPSWPTFNVWNQNTIRQRIIINEPEVVALDPRAEQVHDVAGVRALLEHSPFVTRS